MYIEFITRIISYLAFLGAKLNLVSKSFGNASCVAAMASKTFGMISCDEIRFQNFLDRFLALADGLQKLLNRNPAARFYFKNFGSGR